MLDPGRFIAQAVYYLLYWLARGLWEIDRALMDIAVMVEGVNTWITDNIGYFVQAIVNALEAPLMMVFILAITALGAWYAMNSIMATQKWVDPQKLIKYGFYALFFFGSPIIVIDALEDLRLSVRNGMQAAVLAGAAGDLFDPGMNGTDVGMPAAVPDVNADGVVGSFDLLSYFISAGSLDEYDSTEFPPAFEATYFPLGDPSTGVSCNRLVSITVNPVLVDYANSLIQIYAHPLYDRC